jgi:hypothetical protein
VLAIGHEYVCRLNVAMNDTFGVRCFERIGDLNGETEEHAHFQRAGTNAMLQRGPFQKLHRDEGLGFVFANLVDGGDAGMIQGRCSAGFTSKAFQCLRVSSEVVG